jgi:hypothetical protein
LKEVHQAASGAAIVKALVGQTCVQSAQLMQSPGRGSQGKGPAISRHSAGQIATQSPQAVQQLSSRRGSSKILDMVGFSPLGRRQLADRSLTTIHKGRRDFRQSFAGLGRKEDVGRAQIPGDPGQSRLIAVADDHGGGVGKKPAHPFEQRQFVFQVASELDH